MKVELEVKDDLIESVCILCGINYTQRKYDRFGRIKSKVSKLCSDRCRQKHFVQNNPNYYKDFYEKNPDKKEMYYQNKKKKNSLTL